MSSHTFNGILSPDTFVNAAVGPNYRAHLLWLR
jgi:hypothetical protein